MENGTKLKIFNQRDYQHGDHERSLYNSSKFENYFFMAYKLNEGSSNSCRYTNQSINKLP